MILWHDNRPMKSISHLVYEDDFYNLGCENSTDYANRAVAAYKSMGAIITRWTVMPDKSPAGKLVWYFQFDI